MSRLARRLLSIASCVLLSASCAPASLPPRAASAASTCVVTSPPYGARCDNVTDDHVAIQRALDDAASCGTVLIPAGAACLSRSLNLTAMSGRTLLIAGELVAWRAPASWRRPGDLANNMLLSATSGDGAWVGSLVRGFTLAGGGRLLGGGAAWWPGAASVQRPRLLWLPNASDLHVANLTLVDSPSWHIGVRGERLLMERLVIVAGADSCGGFGHAPNTDGINHGGRDIVIRDVTVHNGDDAFPLTTGNDGTSYNISYERLHAECGTNGLVIYNQGGSIQLVRSCDTTVARTNQGVGVKLSRPGRDATGGLVADVLHENLIISEPRYAAIYINVFQEDAQPPCVLPAKHDLPDWLTVRGFALRNVTAQVAAGQAAGCLRCTPGRPCEGLDFQDVRVLRPSGKPATGYDCFNVANTSSGGDTQPALCV